MLVIDLNLKYISLTISRVPAFNSEIYWDDGDKNIEKNLFFSPSQSVLMGFLWIVGSSNAVEKFLVVEYESPIGVSVRDQFCITGQIISGGFMSGSRLVDRKFRRSACVSLEIEGV